MKGLLRPVFVGGVSVAIALTGLLGGRAEAAANAAPTSMSVVPSATSVFEGDPFTLTVQLDSPATEQLGVQVNWADASLIEIVYLNPGDSQVVFGHTYIDDSPSGSPLDTMAIVVRAENATTSLSKTVPVDVKNAAPTFTSLTVSPSTITGGQSATVAGSFDDKGKADRHSVMVDWGDSEVAAFPRLPAKTYSFSYDHPYPVAGTYTITARVTDDDTGWVEQSVQLTVESTNVSPSHLVLALSPVAEGGSSTLTASFADPDATDTHNVTVNWGDGSGVDTLPTLAALVTTFTPAHTYQDTGAYIVTVVLNDSAGHSITGTTSVSVSNVAPAVSLSAVASPIAGDNFDLSGTFVDPGTLDTFTVSVDWGDATAKGAPALGADGRSFAASHTYATEGSYSLTVTIADRDGASGSATANVVVRHRNVAPSNVTLGAAAVTQGASTSLTGAFSDSDSSDTHSVVLNWGDSTQSTTVSLAAGVTTFGATHGYATAGTWTVSATVTDPASASTSASTQAVVNAAPATTTGALLDQMTDLVKSFGLDRTSERYLMRRIDQMKASIGTRDFCESVGDPDRFRSVARHAMTSEEYASLSDLMTKLRASAHCSGDESGQHEGAALTAPQKPATPTTPSTPTAPKQAPKEDANQSEQKNDQNINGKNNKTALSSNKGTQTNSESGDSVKGARNSRGNN